MSRGTLRSWLAVLALAGGAAAVVASVTSVRPRGPEHAAITAPMAAATSPAVDSFFAEDWQTSGTTSAAPADDLVVLRRVSLTLHGTIPSLEEIRAFEADPRPDRL